VNQQEESKIAEEQQQDHTNTSYK